MSSSFEPSASAESLERPDLPAASYGDPRITRTRARLRAALLAACAKTPLARVSVSQVARAADVARATFYLHYDDLGALAVDSCVELVREAVQALHAAPALPSAPPAALLDLFAAIDARADLYRALLRPGGGGPLGELLHRELRARSLAERQARRPGSADDVVASAVAAAFTGILADWLHSSTPSPPHRLAGQVWVLLRSLHAALPPDRRAD